MPFAHFTLGAYFAFCTKILLIPSYQYFLIYIGAKIINHNKQSYNNDRFQIESQVLFIFDCNCIYGQTKYIKIN